MNSTIAAIITAAGTGAISVARLSGSKAIKIAQHITRKKTFENRRATFCSLFDGHRLIDKGIVTCFYAPNSFTGEDVVEFSVHGGLVISEDLLSVLLNNGAELAQPGEFTRRAYFNGKIGLLEAEAVADLIAAETKKSAHRASRVLNGKMSDEFFVLRQNLLNLLSLVESNIDFYNDGIEIVSLNNVIEKIKSMLLWVEKMLDGYEQTRRSQFGATVVLAGEPNSGKSSLFNYLVRKNRSIVSNIAGTTRDYIIEKISLRGFPVVLFDTAGIHEKSIDDIEKEGVRQSKHLLKKADLVVFLVPPNKKNPVNLPENHLVITSKSDLLLKNQNQNNIGVSAESGSGIKYLVDEIIHMLFDKNTDGTIHKERHKHVLEQLKKDLLSVLGAAKEERSYEIIAEELQTANKTIGLLFGENLPDAVLNNIFASFCVGK